jgi:DNA recombination protein RmuC
MDPFMIESAAAVLIIAVLLVVIIVLVRGKAKLGTAAERIPKLESDLETERAQVRHYQDVARALENDLGRKSGSVDELNKSVSEKNKRIEVLETTVRRTEETWRNLEAENSALREARESDQRLIDELKQVRQQFEQTFGSISKRALSENRQDFLDLAKETLSKYQVEAKGELEKRHQAIGELLSPLHTKLREFEQKVDEVYRTEAAERNTLKGEISRLFELNQQLSKDASSLALALKGDAKKQGNWGELILEKVLEYSGLRKGEEYKLQESHRSEDGRVQKPDAIVYLPDKKHVIIDAKVSLVAYDRYVSAASDEERSVALLEHLASVKRHIQDLSNKNYPSIGILDTPDFTLLFMPIESSFGLAIQADNELFGFAWDRKIVIVSPSTLLATLRTIASIWKQERQTRNAIEIADRAGKMYDKFTGFVSDLITLGKRLNDAKGDYDEAMKKLSTGPGNLVRQSEQLKEMGAKATKQLPGTLLDRAVEASELPLAAGGQPSLLS